MDDPNGDGRPNIQHYAFDTDPLGNGSDEEKIHISTSTDGGSDEYLTITFPVRTGVNFSGIPPTATINGIVYQVFGSSDLLGDDLTVVERTSALTIGMPALSDINGGGADWEYISFRLTDSTSVRVDGFIRVDFSFDP